MDCRHRHGDGAPWQEVAWLENRHPRPGAPGGAATGVGGIEPGDGFFVEVRVLGPQSSALWHVVVWPEIEVPEIKVDERGIWKST